MRLPSDGILMAVPDEVGRPLIIIRRTRKNTIMYVFKRYKGMSQDSIEKVKKMYTLARSKTTITGSDDDGITDINKFLSFESDRPCG